MTGKFFNLLAFTGSGCSLANQRRRRLCKEWCAAFPCRHFTWFSSTARIRLSQNMVVALATDQEVWGAVLANEKLQEYKRRLDGSCLYSSILFLKFCGSHF